MKKTLRATLLAGLGAAAIIPALALTGCSGTSHEAAGTGSPSAKPSATASATPAAKAPVAGTVANPLPQGTAGVTDKGSQWDVTLTTLNTDGTQAVLAQNQFNSIAAGSQFVTGTLTATINKNLLASNTGKTVSASGSVEPVFVGGDGKIYQTFTDTSSMAAVDNDWDSVPSVIANVGVSSSGNFAIAVPSTAVAGGHFGVSNEVSDGIVYFQ
jgi:hypothetical protein